MESQKVKNQRKNKRYSFLISMGIFLLFFSATYFIYDHFEKERQSTQDNQKIEEFFEVEETIEEIPQVDEEQPQEETKVVQQKQDNYIGILEIPKIKIKRGLVDKNSSSNNVNRNIYTVKETTFPDERINSHIILAAHAGNSYVSFFRNLTKLGMKDKVYLYYKGTKYVYEISNRYEIKKTGKAELKFTNTSDRTLISCISGTDKQVVYVATLITKENY